MATEIERLQGEVERLSSVIRQAACQTDSEWRHRLLVDALATLPPGVVTTIPPMSLADLSAALSLVTGVQGGRFRVIDLGDHTALDSFVS